MPSCPLCQSELPSGAPACPFCGTLVGPTSGEGPAGHRQAVRALQAAQDALHGGDGKGADLGVAKGLMERARAALDQGNYRQAEEMALAVKRAIALALRRARMNAAVQGLRSKADIVRELGGSQGELQQAMEEAQRAIGLGDFRAAAATIEKTSISIQTFFSYARGRAALEAAKGRLKEAMERDVDVAPLRPFLLQAEEAFQENDLQALDKALKLIDRALEFAQRRDRAVRKLQRLEEEIRATAGLGVDGSAASETLAQARRALKAGLYNDVDLLTRQAQEAILGTRGRSRLERSLTKAEDRLAELGALGADMAAARGLVEEARKHLADGDRQGCQAKLRSASDALAKAAEAHRRWAMVEEVAAELKDLRELGAETGPVEEALAAARAALEAGDLGALRAACEGAWRAAQVARRNRERQILLVAAEKIVDRVGSGGVSVLGAKELLAEIKKHIGSGKVGDLEQVLEAKFNAEVLRKEKEVLQAMAPLERLATGLREAGMDPGAIEAGLKAVKGALDARRPWEAEEGLRRLEEESRPVRAALRQGAEETLARARVGLRAMEDQGITLPEGRELLAKAEGELQGGAEDRALALGKLVVGVVERAKREHFQEMARREVERLRGEEIARTAAERLKALGEVEGRLRESGVPTEGLRGAMAKAQGALTAGRWEVLGFQLDLGEQLGKGMEDSLHKLAVDIIAKAQETLGRAEAEGLAAGEGREALATAQDALGARRYDAAARSAQRVVQAVDAARHRREAETLEQQKRATQEMRDRFARVGNLLEELKKAGIDISGGEENLLEASRAIQDAQFDQATEILGDMEDMGNSLKASFMAAAQEFITRAQGAIDGAEKLNLNVPEAKEMAENATHSFHDGLYDRAVELAKLAERKAKTAMRTAIDEADAQVRAKVEKAQARIRRLRKVMKDLGRADISIEGAEESLVGAEEALAEGDFDSIHTRLEPVEEMAQGLASGLRVAAQDLLARTRREVERAKEEGLVLPRGEQVMNTAQSAWEEERYVEALEYCKVIEDIIQDIRRKRQAQEVLVGLQGLRAEASALRSVTTLPTEVDDYLLEAMEEAQGGNAPRAVELRARVAGALERARAEAEASVGRDLAEAEVQVRKSTQASALAPSLAAAREALAAGQLPRAKVILADLRGAMEREAEEQLRAELVEATEALAQRVRAAGALGVDVVGIEGPLATLRGALAQGIPGDARDTLTALGQALTKAAAEFAESHKPQVEIEGSGEAPQAGAWNRYGVAVRNQGTAPARDVKLLVRGAGEFRLPPVVETLAPGEERSVEIGWRPSAPGDTSLELQVEYSGAVAGEVRRTSRELRIPVKPSGTYVLDDVFLVHVDGRLIHHASRRYREAVDEDIFSGMLTIVQDFVKDSFRQPTGVGLKRLEFGDSKIIIERGAHVYLAAVLSGHEPSLLPLYMAEVIRDLEVKYRTTLDHWTGLVGDLPGIQDFVEGLLALSSQGTPTEGTVARALQAIEGMRILGADTTEAEALLREAQERVAVEGATALALVEAAVERALKIQADLQGRITATLEQFHGTLEDLKALGQDVRPVEGQVQGASEALRSGDLATAGKILRTVGEAIEGLKGGTIVQRVAEEVERLALRLESMGEADPSLDPLRRELEDLRLRVAQGDLRDLAPRLEGLAKAIDERRQGKRRGEAESSLRELEDSLEHLRQLGVVTGAVEATLQSARDALVKGDVESTENLLAVAQEGLKGVRTEVLRDHQPRLFVRTFGGTLEAGAWNRVTIELTNKGNWPAQDLQLQVQGEVEVQGLEGFLQLPPNEVRQLEIGVKPPKEGSVPVDLEVTYGRVLDDARYALRDARDLTVEKPGTYRVQDVFLFLGDGRLVLHEGSRYREPGDEEGFGKMIQGLEDFLKDSFKQKRSGLRRMEIGGHRVLVERGPREFLAAVVEGEPPALLPLYMVEALNEVEVRFGPQMASWDGKAPEGLSTILRRLFYVTDVAGADLGDLQDSPITAAHGPGPAPPAPLAQALAQVERADFAEALGALQGATRNVAPGGADLSAEVKERALAAAKEGFNVQVDDASLRNYIDLLKKVDRAIKRARAKANVNPTWPVRKVAIRMVSEELANAVQGFASVIMHQGNAKELDVVRPGEIWRGLNLKMDINAEVLAKSYKGVLAKKIELILKSQDPWKIRTGVEKGQYNLGLEGMTIKVTPEMVIFTSVLPPHVTIQDFDAGIIYLDTQMTPEIKAEIVGREVVRLVRQARRELGLGNEVPLAVTVEADAGLVKVLTPIKDAIAKDARAGSLLLTSHSEAQEGILAECEAAGEKFNLIIVPPESDHDQDEPPPPPPPPDEAS